MCGNQVGYVYIVSYPRSVDGGEVRSENIQTRLTAQRYATGTLDQVSCIRRRLSRSAVWVGARDIKISQSDMPKGAVRPRGILQHPFRHQFRSPVGVDRFGG